MLPEPLPPMAAEDPAEARREYAQLLRLHERMNTQLIRVRDELAAPELAELLQEISLRTGSSPRTSLVSVKSAVEEALRTLAVAASEAHQALTHHDQEADVAGIVDLPPTLSRFLAERLRMEGFEYEVLQDEVRGWMIRWREYTADGHVRGFGQFYERPYAWLDD